MSFKATQRPEGELVVLVNDLSTALVRRGFKLVTVESCTGGSVSALLTDFAGSSVWFDRGFVTYSNLAKIQMVGVQAASLDRYGAVSEEVAGEMAIGGVANSEAQCAVSITGIAGPGGGSEAKPVGTVYFGWAGFGGEILIERQLFAGNRAAIRLQSVVYALEKANTLLAG